MKDFLKDGLWVLLLGVVAPLMYLPFIMYAAPHYAKLGEYERWANYLTVGIVALIVYLNYCVLIYLSAKIDKLNLKFKMPFKKNRAST